MYRIILNKIVYGIVLILITSTLSAKPMLNIQHWQTANGATVFFVPTTGLAMLDIQIAFDAGSKRDAKTPGLAELTANMLGAATTKLSADQIAQHFDNVGAVFSANVERDMAVISLRSLSQAKYLQPALATFTEVLTDAKFPQQSLQRVKQQTLRTIEQQKQQPSAVANMKFYRALYGSQPYAHPIIGQTDIVKQLTQKQTQGFYQRYYVSRNATITIVGTVNLQQAKNIASQLSKNMRVGQAAAQLAPTKQRLKNSIEEIEFPSTQTHIRIGQIGIDHQNPNYFPLYLGNYILGNGFMSRLFKQVRGKHGLSYYVYSYFMPLQERGPFVIGLQTKNSSADYAIELSKKILTDYEKTGPTSTELANAKQAIIGGFPLRFSSNREISNNLLTMAYYRLPMTYFDTYRDNIAKVSKVAVKNAFAKTIIPKDLVTIAVGNDKAS